MIKIKATPPQSQLTIAKRKQNLQGAFVCTGKYPLKGKRILLVDDILTTGATAGECTTILKQNGAKQVYVAVLAKPGEKILCE